MGYALVSQGTVAANGTPAFGQPTTAGDLLLLWGWSNNGNATDPFTVTGTGWTHAVTAGGAFNWVTLYYRADCGAAESPPVFSFPSTVTSMLAEFSGGAASSPLDQTGTGASTSYSAPAADTAASDLVTALAVWNGGNSGPTMTMALAGSNGSPLSATTTDNNGAGSGPFYIWGWAVNDASLGATADAVTLTIDMFENNPAALVASFLPASGPPPPQEEAPVYLMQAMP